MIFKAPYQITARGPPGAAAPGGPRINCNGLQFLTLCLYYNAASRKSKYLISVSPEKVPGIEIISG